MNPDPIGYPSTSASRQPTFFLAQVLLIDQAMAMIMPTSSLVIRSLKLFSLYMTSSIQDDDAIAMFHELLAELE